jgi:hypothetical protein
MVKKYMKYTQEKIDFVHAMFGNNFPNSVTIRGFKEQFNETINDRQIDYMMKEKIPTSIRQLEEMKMAKMAESVNVKAWHNDTASRKQCSRLLALTYPTTNGKDRNLMVKELYESGTLSKKEAHDKIEILTRKLEEVIHTPKEPVYVEQVVETIVSEVIGETTTREPRFTRTRHKWTDEEELGLLCDFYELSIDEARERFQRPFYAIAKRLELIVDSTEPKHIDMLMVAARIIKQRKREADKVAKQGYWKRRQVRKTAKRIAKLDKQLLKLRGE